MITPLEIENKKFSKQALNGYSTEEVDDFLDEITADYEKLYKQVNELKEKIENSESDLEHYKTIEATLNNTLIMAQTTAEEVKDVARKQAEQIVNDAHSEAKKSLGDINAEIKSSKKELEETKRQFDVYKAKMESLLISELLKEINQDEDK